MPASLTILCVRTLFVRPESLPGNNVLLTGPDRQKPVSNSFLRRWYAAKRGPLRRRRTLERDRPPRCRDFALPTPRGRATLDGIDSLGAGPTARGLGTRRRFKRSTPSTGSSNGILSKQTGPSGLDRTADRALADYGERVFAARGNAPVARLAGWLPSR